MIATPLIPDPSPRGGEKGGWTRRGVFWSLLAGTAGALGALGVILALGFGGKPISTPTIRSDMLSPPFDKEPAETPVS